MEALVTSPPPLPLLHPLSPLPLPSLQAFEPWSCGRDQRIWSQNLLAQLLRPAPVLQNCCNPATRRSSPSFNDPYPPDTWSLERDYTFLPQVLSSICNRDVLNEAIQALHYMDQECVGVEVDVYYQLVLRSGNEKNLLIGRKVHVLVASKGLESNEYLGAELVRMFIHVGSLSEANQVILKLPDLSFCVWNTYLSTKLKVAQNELALENINESQRLDEQQIVPGLKTCSSMGNGLKMHSTIIENGIEHDNYIKCALIDMYKRCGSLEDAYATFERFPKDNVVMWNTLITAYCDHGCSEQALKLFDEMQYEGIKPDRVTFLGALKACTNMLAYDYGRKIHVDILEVDLERGASVGSALINMYGKCGQLMDANCVFERLPNQNTVMWNSLITALVQHGAVEEALQMFQKMQLQVEPDKVTFICVIKACLRMATLEDGKLVHTQVVDSVYASDSNISNTLIDMYVNCGSLHDAHCTFHKMSSPNVVSWSILIAGYADHGWTEEALELFEKMQEEGIQPNEITLAGVLKACSDIGAIDHVWVVHSFVVENGLGVDIAVVRALMDTYIRCRSLEHAYCTSQRLRENDVTTLTVLIEGCIQLDCVDEGMGLIKNLIEENFDLDPVFFSCALKACSSKEAIDEGRQIHAHVLYFGFSQDTYMGSTLVDFYVKCGQLEEACIVFDRLDVRSVVTWNTLMTGHTNHGNNMEVLELYQEMQKQGVEPDPITCLCALRACSDIVALEHGKRVHAYIIEKQLDFHDFVGSSLVDMYAKCGSLEDAWNMFNRLPRKTVVSWNALIAGCAQQNNYALASQLFHNMHRSGLEMNAVTYLCLISACSRGGLLQEGLSHFISMQEDHHITPMLEHYNLLVDLLGHRSYLNEAEDLLETIPFKQNAIGWTSLLSSCKHCMNITIAKRCFGRCISLEKANAAAYVLLSGIYENAGLVLEATKLEDLRVQSMCWKKPAKAFIEIDGSLHSFTVGDTCHPESPRIYSKLSSLNLEMCKEEYRDEAPDQGSFLRKEEKMRGHCEKLAIAFGLIHTAAGTTIRVSKNLRMCDTCHSSSKLISKLEARQIIVSDTFCIHRFEDGECSCGM